MNSKHGMELPSCLPLPLSHFFPPSVLYLDGKPKDHARTRPSMSSERLGKDAAEEEATGAGKESREEDDDAGPQRFLLVLSRLYAAE